MNTSVDDVQVPRHIIRALAKVAVSRRINMRSEGALSVSVAHANKIRPNIYKAAQICSVEVYASTA